MSAKDAFYFKQKLRDLECSAPFDLSESNLDRILFHPSQERYEILQWVFGKVLNRSIELNESKLAKLCKHLALSLDRSVVTGETVDMQQQAEFWDLSLRLIESTEEKSGNVSWCSPSEEFSNFLEDYFNSADVFNSSKDATVNKSTDRCRISRADGHSIEIPTLEELRQSIQEANCKIESSGRDSSGRHSSDLVRPELFEEFERVLGSSLVNVQEDFKKSDSFLDRVPKLTDNRPGLNIEGLASKIEDLYTFRKALTDIKEDADVLKIVPEPRVNLEKPSYLNLLL